MKKTLKALFITITLLYSFTAIAADVVLPYGAIIMWSGSMNEIPDGWAVCNGQNGTPNLQGRFIVGYGANKGEEGYTAIGNKGGKNFQKLDTEQLPPHTHPVEINTGGGHYHYVQSNGRSLYKSTDAGDTQGTLSLGTERGKQERIVTDNDGAHTHTGTVKENIDLSDQETFDNRPVYYVLAFIMKVAH